MTENMVTRIKELSAEFWDAICRQLVDEKADKHYWDTRISIDIPIGAELRRTPTFWITFRKDTIRIAEVGHLNHRGRYFDTTRIFVGTEELSAPYAKLLSWAIESISSYDKEEDADETA